MAEYCLESDLVLIRPDILNLGIDEWSEQITEAGKIIDRAIDVQWYRRNAEDYYVDWRSNPFDRDRLSNVAGQLTRTGCYKTLELIYLYLMKHRIDDAFAKERDLFAKLYKDEIAEVMASGIDYDWDNDDDEDADETFITRTRRLKRV